MDDLKIHQLKEALVDIFHRDDHKMNSVDAIEAMTALTFVAVEIMKGWDDDCVSEWVKIVLRAKEDVRS